MTATRYPKRDAMREAGLRAGGERQRVSLLVDGSYTSSCRAPTASRRAGRGRVDAHREDEVGAEVGDLEHGRLELGDAEALLDLGVEDVDEAVRDTPELQARLRGISGRNSGREEAREGRTKKSEVMSAKAKYSCFLDRGGPAALTPVAAAAPPAIVSRE